MTNGYQVAIRNNETGEIRFFRYDFPWDDASDYQWTDGNYGCDCNRGLFFERAAGGNPDLGAHECGTTKYSCLHAILPDGTSHPIDENDR